MLGCGLVLQAVRLGLSGFGAGMSVGKALIEEQACLLNGLLTYSSSLLGSPCESIRWQHQLSARQQQLVLLRTRQAMSRPVRSASAGVLHACHQQQAMKQPMPVF